MRRLSEKGLSSRAVQRYLQEVEMPRRQETDAGPADEIVRYGGFVGSSLECHRHLPRAMEHARRHIDTEEKAGRSVRSGRIILADELSGSKGRFSRGWHAPPGGLWGCLIHANTLSGPSTLLLSLALGVAACESLREFGAESASIRWVNDVLVDDAKIVGFLVESHTGPCWGEVFHLIGFGVNINNDTFPAELENIAISLNRVLGRSVDVTAFAVDFIAKLAWNLGLLYYTEARRPDWMEEPDTFCHPLLRRWKELSDTLGREVVFGYDVLENPQYQATVAGITGDGGLRLVLADGREVTEYSGEIRYRVP